MALADTTTEPTEHTLQSALHDHSDRTDAQEAYALAMTMRSDLDFEARLQSARNRILKLSVQLWEARKALRIAASQPDREAVARLLYNRFHNPELWDHPLSVIARDNCYEAADALSLLSVQVDGEQKEAHATKPSPGSTSATATETALRAAKRLCDNINEFGHVTDAEIFDATETAIQKALETINVA